MGGPAAVADALTHRGGTPTVHGRWEALISLEYQTCTSPHPFDTLVTGMGWYGVWGEGVMGSEEKKVEDVGFPVCHAVTPA